MAKLSNSGDIVFRVRQIPLHVQFHELASLLHRALNYTGPSDHVRVFSLAPSVDSIDQSKTKVATIGFVTVPDVFSTNQNEWTFHIPGMLYTIIIDTHFLGFTTLNDVRPEDHTVDCFAISGLASHPFGSWKPHNSSSNFMWLRDALPQSFPTARVIIYGYDTNLVGSQSFQDIEDIAISFIARFGSIGSTLPSAKPTIFLAHSLGGVALKQALVHLANGARHDIFLSKIKKIIFFGVPNRGMKVSHLLPIVQGQPNETLVRLLQEGSGYLSFLDEQFSGISFVRRVHLVSVYETHRSQTPLETAPGRWERNGPFEILVEKKSAIHRFSDNGDIYPVNKDHSNLVKFVEDESDLKTILNFIRTADRTLPRLIDTNDIQTEILTGSLNADSAEFLPPIGKFYDSSFEERLDYREQVATFLDSLRKGETTHRYDQVSRAHELTFDWVFERGGVGLTEWLENGRGLFWITGKPGSGKSTLMKYIWNNRHEERRCNAGSYTETAEVERHDSAGWTGGQGVGDDSSEDGRAETQHSYSSFESMRSENGNEVMAHDEPSGQTTAHFFFSHQGSEMQRSFEGLLHCVLYEIFSRGVEVRHKVGALRVELGREIPKAEADLATKAKSLPRLEYEYSEAITLSQKECERQGREWSGRDERMKRLREKREEANAETDPEASMKIKRGLVQEKWGDLRERGLKDREDTISSRLVDAKAGLDKQQSRVDKLKANYKATVTCMDDSRVWRHENAQLLHSALQKRLTLSPGESSTWTAADLEAALLQILTQRQCPIKITLFLDALDEYAGSPKKIVDFLEHAIRQTKHSMTRLRICFASRPWDVFNDRFINQPGFCMQDHTRSDIDNYAKSRMRRHIATNTLSKKLGRTLRLRILERAEGVFLWVQSVLDTILVELVHGASPEELHCLLAAIPDGLEDLYSATLGRIEYRYRKESYVMLEIVLRSEHLMEFGRFWETVQNACSNFDRPSAHSQSSSVQERKYWHYTGLYDMVSRRIRSRCGGLLEIRNGAVQLMHSTVHDFLLQPGTMRSLLEPSEKLATFNGHSFLVQELANRLSQPSEERLIALRGWADQHETLSLVHSYMYHANQAELSTGMSQIMLVDSVEDWNGLAELYFPDCAPSLPLAFAVVADLRIYMRDLLHQSSICPRDLTRLLHCAVEFHTRSNYRRGLMVTDLSGMIKLLLESGADPRIYMHGMAPFQCLFRKGAQGVVNNNICDESSLNIAKVLLKAPGTDPDGDVMMGTSSAHLAGFPQNGNDVLIRCKPLHVAGGVSMIRLLLNAGADVNGLNSEGQTPLDVFCSTRSVYADAKEVEDAYACKRELQKRGGIRKSPLLSSTSPSGSSPSSTSLSSSTSPINTRNSGFQTGAYPKPKVMEENSSSKSLAFSTNHLLRPHKARDATNPWSMHIWNIFFTCIKQRREPPTQSRPSSTTPSNTRYPTTNTKGSSPGENHTSHHSRPQTFNPAPTSPLTIDETTPIFPTSKSRRVPHYLHDSFPGDKTPLMIPVGKPRRGGPDYLRMISSDSKSSPDDAFQPVYNRGLSPDSYV